ncbi:MAG: preprotein translocase subunit SecY [Phycisphaerales bacterium]|nr:preprotein translocase subunit SecY [Phycisphaerales bacterium]
MLQALINVFKIAELRNKILFTIGMLAVYRLGHWIPLPGVNQEQLAQTYNRMQEESSAASSAVAVISMLSGGAFGHSTIFGLGVAPYISASIIFQLLMTVWPALKKLQEEGPTGRQKIMEWTRYATIVLAIIQAVSWLKVSAASNLIYSQWIDSPAWWIMAVTALTASTVFLMWLGEQIDKHGIGNGVSMLIMAGILAAMPGAIKELSSAYSTNSITLFAIFMLVGLFVLVIGSSVLLTVAQRRIAVQQAKHTRGRKVYGGQRSYLPLRINHSGVMPVIFASSLMIFPSMILNALASGSNTESFLGQTVLWFNDQLTYGHFIYIVGEVILIYFFSYFWITVQFNPEDMAKQLREHGSFIPGLRPGPRTAEYLESVMERITFVGAAFLSVIAVLPMVVAQAFNISPGVAQFLGGTGLLIVVSVVLDFMQRVEANLLMRNYAGFLSGADGKGSRIPGPRAA